MKSKKIYLKPSIYVVDVDTDNEFMKTSQEYRPDVIPDPFYGDAKKHKWGFNPWYESPEEDNDTSL